jgi:hypothetical protein
MRAMAPAGRNTSPRPAVGRAGGGTEDVHVRRLKGSIDCVHTLDRDEVSAWRKLKASSTSPFVFVSERGGPLSPA